MNKKRILILIILIIFFAVIGSYSIITESTNYPSVVLGETELGKVSLEGPFGNSNSENKIAIIIGVHPLEYKAHDSILKYLKEYSSSLNSSYYVYVVDVGKDADNFDKSRVNGQILARYYVVPDIVSKDYDFCVDIHGHRNAYSQENFIIAPLNDAQSVFLGREIIKDISGMGILDFLPADDGHPTSPDYVSIPILKNGTPSLIYETSIYQSNDIVDNFMLEFLLNLDNIIF